MLKKYKYSKIIFFVSILFIGVILSSGHKTFIVLAQGINDIESIPNSSTPLVPLPTDAPLKLKEKTQQINTEIRINTPVDKNQSVASTPDLKIPILGFFLICGLIVVIVLFKKGLLPPAGEKAGNNITSSKLDNPNDQRRKDDLQRLCNLVEGYCKLNKHFPNETEFNNLYRNMDSPPHDPQEGAAVPGNGKPPFYQYGYFYEQRKWGEKDINPNFYRLWCFLENGDYYQLTSQDKTTPSVLEPEEQPTPKPLPVLESMSKGTVPIGSAPEIRFAPVINNYQTSNNFYSTLLIVILTLTNIGIFILNLYFQFIKK